MPKDHDSKDNFIHTVEGENRSLFASLSYDLSSLLFLENIY